MPIDRYLYIRKAAEVEEISNRIQMISDINAAFSGSNERLEKLQRLYIEVMGFEIPCEADKNWEERLKTWQR